MDTDRNRSQESVQSSSNLMQNAQVPYEPIVKARKLAQKNYSIQRGGGRNNMFNGWQEREHSKMSAEQFPDAN